MRKDPKQEQISSQTLSFFSSNPSQPGKEKRQGKYLNREMAIQRSGAENVLTISLELRERERWSYKFVCCLWKKNSLQKDFHESFLVGRRHHFFFIFLFNCKHQLFYTCIALSVVILFL